MKHILNNLSSEEKNNIREQYEGGMSVDTSKFKKLVETKLGDAKPLINESYDFIKKAKDLEKYTVVAGDTLWSITKKLFEKYFTPEELKKWKMSYEGAPSLDQVMSRFINNLVVFINGGVVEGYLKQDYGVTKIDNPDSLVTGSILVLPNSKAGITGLLSQDWPHWSKSVNI
jgi:thymidylate synthase